MKNILRKRVACLLLCCVMLLPMALTLPVFAASNDALITISQTSPAIPADVGQTVDLSKYRLQIAATTILEPDKLTWSSTEVTVTGNKVIAPAKGVYTLSVTNGSIKRNVYLVTKEPEEKEYVLYETDFSDASVLNDWKKLQQTSGAKYSVSGGVLTMDASDATSSYIRLMLPAFLNDFGDYHFEAKGTVTKAQNDGRGLSLMFRIQKNDYPYYQMCVRQNATASNGTEFAERTEKNAWNVTHKTGYGEKLSASGEYTFAVDAAGKNVATSINGERLIWTPTATKYSKGGLGLQVNGCCAKFTSLKVTLMTEEVEGTPTKLVTVREPKSNLVQTPSIISCVDDFDEIMIDSPATAILFINSALEVVQAAGGVLGTVDEAMAILDKKVIPAFYVTDEATVRALCDYLKKHEIVDVFVMAEDESLIRLARDTYTPIRGIMDWSGFWTAHTDAHQMSMADIRARTNASGARVAVIPASMATAANVEALQRLFITVWVRQEKPYDTVEMVSNITSGANGIITKNRAGLEQCFTSYFLENTITRVVNVIGHRGQPSTGQENSIASSIEAYEAGATMIENDIRLTKDGVLIVMHDATLERSTNGDGNVEAMTSAAIQRFVIDGNTAKATQPIPTLEDYFKEFKGKDVQIIIEIKSGMEALIDPLIELIKKYEMTDQVNIITFTAIQIERLKAKYPELSVGYLTSSISLSEEEPLVTVEQILEHVQKYETTFNPSYASGALGPNVMQAAWHRGITFWPWTVNKIEDFDKYFMYGANGITTNYSYWVENYLKNVTTEQSSYSLMVGEELDIPVLTTTYSRRQSTSNKGYMTVITGNPDGISYRQGQLKATEAGEYTVIFRHASTLKSGGVYYMCSQPVTITVEAEQSDSVETTPSETTPTDPSQGTDGTTAFPILSVAAVVAVVVMSGVVVAAIVILRKKSKQS